MSRPTCSHCFQLTQKCICSTIIKKISPFKIFIIRDKNEKKHPFNTVNILQLNLDNITIVDIDPDQQNDSLYKEYINNSESTYLLFPNEKSIEIGNESMELDLKQLVVLDGTWNKTKKIFFQSPFLQSLPSIRLKLTQSSQYQIRKSSLEYGLSTIEAVTSALNLLTTENYNELLKPFHKLIEIQLELEKIGKKKGSD